MTQKPSTQKPSPFKTKKVLILAAGRGSRMGELIKDSHKALLPVEGRAILSHIIDSFSSDAEFVVATGFNGEKIRQFCRAIYSHRKIVFADVDRFDGPGTGPGYSAYCARAHLQEPFYLICADTLWSEPLPGGENWVGTRAVARVDSANYFNVTVEGRRVTGIANKVEVDPVGHRAFIGVAHIRDWSIFLGAYEKIQNTKREIGFDLGFENLIKKSFLKSHKILSWKDFGRKELYLKNATKN